MNFKCTKSLSRKQVLINLKGKEYIYNYNLRNTFISCNEASFHSFQLFYSQKKQFWMCSKWNVPELKQKTVLDFESIQHTEFSNTLKYLFDLLKNMDLSALTTQGKYLLVKRFILEDERFQSNSPNNEIVFSNNNNNLNSNLNNNLKSNNISTTPNIITHKSIKNIAHLHTIGFSSIEERCHLQHLLKLNSLHELNTFVYKINRMIRIHNEKINGRNSQDNLNPKKNKSQTKSQTRPRKSKSNKFQEEKMHQDQNNKSDSSKTNYATKANHHNILKWIEDKQKLYEGVIQQAHSNLNPSISISELLKILKDDELEEIQQMTRKFELVSLQRHLMYILNRPKHSITPEKKNLVKNYLLNHLKINNVDPKQTLLLTLNNEIKKDNTIDNDREFISVNLTQKEYQELCNLCNLSKFQIKYIINELKDPPRVISEDEFQTIQSWILSNFDPFSSISSNDRNDMSQRFKISRKQLNNILQSIKQAKL